MLFTCFREDDFDYSGEDLGELSSLTIHLSGNDGWAIDWVSYRAAHWNKTFDLILLLFITVVPWFK